MSSRAWLVDLIRAIGEKTAEVDHLEEKLTSDKGYNTEVLLGFLENVLELRREEMDILLQNGERPNPDFWCDFKHAVKSYTHDTEVFEANPNEENLAILKKSGDILAGATTLFLGMEFATCSRCLYDHMLTNQIMGKRKENGLG